MKKTLAFLVLLVMVLTLFSGVTALAAEGDVTVAGLYAGSTQIVVTYAADIFPHYSNTSATLYGHPTAFDPDLGSIPSMRLDPDGGSFTINLTAPLVEGMAVRLAIGNPITYFIPLQLIVAPAPPKTSINNDANIIITAPAPLSPFFLDPNGEESAAMFSEHIRFDDNLNFGTHEFTANQIAIDSTNTLTMVYGYRETYVPNISVFEITCSVSDFLLEDDTPIFNDFSLQLTNVRRTSGEWTWESHVERASVYEDKDVFSVAVDEPVVAVKTDARGHALNNFTGTLLLDANDMANVGAANATITWDVAFAVEP